MYKINYVSLDKQWLEERDELLPLLEEVLRSGQYIGSKYVEEFEKSAALFCQTKHCIGLNSGTDALVFGLAAMGITRGDEVITPPNSFIASTSAIRHLGAIPKFVDVLPDQNLDPKKIESAITSKTKAIMPVHLTGRMARIDEIKKIADKYHLQIIEDSAQSMGSKYNHIPSGKLGDVGCFSAHPLKNLNACGDAGFLVTDNDEFAEKIRVFRNHGLVDRNKVREFGYVSRMDAIQAVILSFRLRRLSEVTKKRRANAALYTELLDKNLVFIPEERAEEFNTYHTYVIQVNNRDRLKKSLESEGIETAIHYPIPIHLQPAAQNLGYKLGDFPITEDQSNKILTLPVNQYLSSEDIAHVAERINYFMKQ
jgi:dTDP-4-amino-4,6-dideoxygalactose transaminase